MQEGILFLEWRVDKRTKSKEQRAKNKDKRTKIKD